MTPKLPPNKTTVPQGQRPVAGDFSRRDFLKGTLAAGVVVGGGLGAFYFGYDKALGSPVRVGVIGVGDQCGVLLGALNPAFIEVKSIADIRPYSIHRAFKGDHYSDYAMKLKPGLVAKYRWNNENEARKHVKVYGTYPELIANAKADGLEGVIIALPLHLHAEAAISAISAGLHVFTEKLMAHSVHECKEMARAAKQTGLLLAVGHQRHYNILYANAQESIRQGLLGQVHYIRAQWHRDNMPGNDTWQPPLPPGVKPKDPQSEELVKKLKTWQKELDKAEGRDIDVWQARVDQLKAQIADKTVDAEKFGYQSHQIKDASGKVIYEAPPIEELIRWRLWDRTGAGLMGELGGHQLDAAGLYVAAAHGGKKQIPLTIVASAGRPLFPPDREADDHVYCIVEYPAPGYDAKDPLKNLKKIGVQYAAVNGNDFGGYGEIVYGTKRTLLLEREWALSIVPDPAAAGKISISAGKPAVLDTQASGYADVEASKSAADPDAYRGYKEEIEHWAWCIRNPAQENKPRCYPAVALCDAVIVHAANMSAREGRPIEFKNDWFTIESDDTPEGIAPDLNRYKG
ncbi:MAG: Gfo/Idh/MocA family oxidoreductase [Thermoguttaceae bacterium]|jgi:predicted dehydrogenase